MILRLLKNVLRDLWLKYRQKARVRSFTGVDAIAEGDGFRNDVAVEVFIPALEKDLETLPLVVQSVKKHLRHNIRSIAVVCPASDVMRRACNELGVQFLNEKEVAPKPKEEIRYMSGGQNRAGWMYQQLLKFSCVLASKADYAFICDADTIFLRDQGFIAQDGVVFDVPIENHLPYKKAYETLTGLTAPRGFSLTSHHIMVEREKVQALVNLLEERHQKPWWEALCSIIDEAEGACHSDYDTMGYYMLANGHHYLRYGENGSFSRRYLWVTRLPGISRLYRTLSFHAYNGY